MHDGISEVANHNVLSHQFELELDGYFDFTYNKGF